jgi:hypothetical protein
MTKPAPLTRSAAKRIILSIFDEKVKGKKPDSSKANTKHCGKDGHWLEKQFGLKSNGKNAPDIFGFEMKNNTGSKTSFGDWSPNYWIFKTRGNPDSELTRDDFFELFGRPNQAKNNRLSWSGDPFPKVNKWNRYGQRLEIDRNKNINAVYDFSRDQRSHKSSLIPSEYQSGKIILASWTYESLKVKLENKFLKFGWFKCLQNSSGIYEKIVFGDPVTFEFFLGNFLSGDIYIDCGMYQGNKRPYMTWRASNKFWDNMSENSPEVDDKKISIA